MELIFGGIMLVGLLYLLLMIFGGIGDALDFGVDGALQSTGLDGVFGLGGAEASDASGLGCSVIAAFMAGFGAMGLTGASAGWSLPIMIGLALLVGWVMARVVVGAMRYVLAQQSTEVFTLDSMIGKSARVTIDSPAGKTGEVMVEDAHVMKYPVQEIDGRALKRGDLVEVVDISGRFLRVKKK